jgi:hypothetical protein
VAGLAPILGVTVRAGLHLIGSAPGDGVLDELGLIGTQAGLLAILSSGIAAFVLGREAARRHDLALVALAGTVLATGAATTWVAADPTREANTLGAPALFVALQLVVMLCSRDAFWRKPARAVGLGGEVLAALAFPVAALYILAAPFIELLDDRVRSQFGPGVGVAWSLLAVGWLLAAWRRRPPTASVLSVLRDSVSDTRTVLFFASAAGAAAVTGTSSTRVAAIAFLLLAAALVASRGVFATVIAAGLAAWTPVTLMGTVPMGVAAVGLLAAGVVVAAAILCVTPLMAFRARRLRVGARPSRSARAPAPRRGTRSVRRSPCSSQSERRGRSRWWRNARPRCRGTSCAAVRWSSSLSRSRCARPKRFLPCLSPSRCSRSTPSGSTTRSLAAAQR